MSIFVFFLWIPVATFHFLYQLVRYFITFDGKRMISILRIFVIQLFEQFGDVGRNTGGSREIVNNHLSHFPPHQCKSCYVWRNGNWGNVVNLILKRVFLTYIVT